MKIAITSTGGTLGDALDTRFGRALRFIIYDTETKEAAALDNVQNLNAPQGAGIQAAARVAEAGAAAVLTGHCGPKAFRVLSEAGIGVYLTAARTGAEAVALFEEGKLTKAEAADVAGHWA